MLKNVVKVVTSLLVFSVFGGSIFYTNVAATPKPTPRATIMPTLKPKSTPKPVIKATPKPKTTSKPVSKATHKPITTSKPVSRATPKPVVSKSLSSLKASTAAKIMVDNTAEIIVTGTYNDGTKVNEATNCTWESSDTSVATVSNGTITGVSAGTSTITVTLGTKSIKLKVTVVTKSLSSLKASTAAKIMVGNTAEVTVTGTYNDGTKVNEATNCTWKSSNISVATVSDGTITGVSAGTATITATLGTKSISLKVTVVTK